MARSRISTTVDADLLAQARGAFGPSADSELVDAALLALVNRHRAAEIDDSYRQAYQEIPLDAPDEWGDLASFRAAAAER